MDTEEKKRRSSEYGKAYYVAHREQVLARQRARAGTERAKEINRKAVAKYRAIHREEINRSQREASARWYVEHPEEARASARRSYAKHIDKARARANEYGSAHAKERAERAAKWREANPDRVKELALEERRRRKERWDKFLEQERLRYRRAFGTDPGKYAAKGAARRCAKLRATPPWCDLAAIADIYRLARKLTEETGIEHDVDHIIPLRGKNVCGLHIPINLQILTSTENRKKFNRLVYDTASDHNSPLRAPSVATDANGRPCAAYCRGGSSASRKEHCSDVDGPEACSN